jgi:hypothetical protein
MKNVGATTKFVATANAAASRRDLSRIPYAAKMLKLRNENGTRFKH